jgi:hypothetical protein
VVAGQRRRMLNEQQTTGMLQFAGLSPSIRGQYLQDVMSRKDLGGFNEGEQRLRLLFVYKLCCGSSWCFGGCRTADVGA